jgi:Cu(I)/Ag(I) efflux system membrane fusion protein
MIKGENVELILSLYLIMKIKTIKSFLLLLVLGQILLTFGCQQEQKAAESAENPPNPANVAGRVAGDGTIANDQIAIDAFVEGDTMNFRDQAPQAFQAQLNEVVQAYLGLKEALVQADVKAAEEYSTRMTAALQNTDGSLLDGTARTFWEEKKTFLARHLRLSLEAQDIAAKRENFVFLSTPMVKVVQAFGGGGQELYIQYCPMANENRGAYWVSQEKAIRNPFMGESMLTCGEVKKKI